MLKWLIILLFGLALCPRTEAQFRIEGEVGDSKDKDLAFVSVLVDDDSFPQVAFTDIDGRFSLALKRMPRALIFRYVGYETLRIDSLDLSLEWGRPLDIVLHEAQNTLREVTILPGENPADRIIRKVVANRERHDPDQRAAYACTIYGKQSMQTNANWRGMFRLYAAGRDSSLFAYAMDSSVVLSSRQKRRLQRLDKDRKTQLPADHDALLIESVVRRYFLYPDLLKQEVLQNRVSGFQDLPVAAIPDLIQPFSFYRDYIALVDKAFVNPISPNSPDLYFFNLEDTLYQGRDTVYVISFRPHKGRVFDALKGTLCINTDGWAVQNVRAEPANTNSNLWVKIEQQYQRYSENGGRYTVDGTRLEDTLPCTVHRVPSTVYRAPSTVIWFPEQLNFELAFGDAAGLQMKATGRSRVTELDFHPQLRPTDFDPEIPLVFHPDANTRSDSAWARWHEALPLSERERRTFEALDSFGQHYHFDRIAWFFRASSAKVAPISRGVGVDATRLLVINDYERWRPGLGLTTTQQQPFQLAHPLDAAAWTGYGIRDRRWKYGGSLMARTGKLRNNVFTLAYRHDLAEAGAPEGWLDFRGGFDRSIYAKMMSTVDEGALSLRAIPVKDFSLYLALRVQAMTPTFPYVFAQQPERQGGDRFRFAESIVSVRYAWGELANELVNADWQLQQRAPVLELIWTRGWNGLMGGQYAYDRLVAAVYQSRFIRRWGKMSWRLEAGIVSANTPLLKLFTLSQPGGEGLASAFTVANTIQTAKDTLVVSDRYISLFFSQQIGNVLYRKRWSAPYLTLLQNAAWGDLHHPEYHAGIGFRSLQKPLFESGMRLDDLLRINILHFGYLGGGAAVYYGWGPYAYTDWRKNVTLRAAVRWSF